MSSDREEIRRIFEERYPENVRTKNIQGYGAVFSEDALWMPADAPDRYGPADIMAGFAEQVATRDIDPVLTAEEIQVFGDFGYVVGLSVATICPSDGSPAQQAKFRAVWLMKKVAGQWQLHRQIWNNKPV